MSQGDEYEAGEPRKPLPSMRRYDERDDDEPDLRDRKYAGRQRSGAVTAVGIVAIILGSLGLIAGLCIGCLSGVMPAMQAFAKQNANDPQMQKAAQDLGRVPIWLLVAEALVNTIRGAGLLAGGIGVLRRSQIARWLTLAMAGFGIVALIADTGVTLALGLLEPSGMLGTVFGGLFGLGFALFAGIVLLTPKFAAEFGASNE